MHVDIHTHTFVVTIAHSVATEYMPSKLYTYTDTHTYRPILYTHTQIHTCIRTYPYYTLNIYI
jgi:hypothetical protein